MRIKSNFLKDELKPILYTTIGIILFMIIMPTVTIKSKVNDSSVAEEDISKPAMTNETVTNEINFAGSDKIKVYITAEDRIEEVNIEDYICGVVSNEMPAGFADEALKAQAVASRTYLASKMVSKCSNAKGADICDSVHCQVYTSKEKRMSNWDAASAESNWEKIKNAVEATKGQVLSYNGELVKYPQFFSTSSGKTENAVDTNWGDVPYLKSVESVGEEVAPKFTSEKPIAISAFVDTVNSKYPDAEIDVANISNEINIISRSDAGGVKELKVGNQEMKGTDFRFLVGLNSTNFTYSIDGENIIFNCKGYGHGVGMSQWGANVMAKNGSGYNDILKHYYTGVDISNLKYN